MSVRADGSVPERELQGRLGLTRDELRGLRKKRLTGGVDFITEKNGTILIRPSGVEKIAAALAVGLPAADPKNGAVSGRLDEKNGAPAGVGEATEGVKELLPKKGTAEVLVALCVLRIFPKNRHVIEGYRQGTDPAVWKNRVRIRVKDASRYGRFTPEGAPVVLRCRHLQADFYEHAEPMPRRRGRI